MASKPGAPKVPSRVPPADVRRELAAEVGFGCPVDGCGSPYLTWHHFDPPWAVRKHHEPTGMIALCRDHHPEADAGAFTDEQLRAFKLGARNREVGGRFNWMREKLLAVVGGNFYYDTSVVVQFKDMPVVWFNRDEDGRLLANITMLTTSGEPRMQMRDNCWITEGTDEREIVCPPSGRSVIARYPNGDKLGVEFRELDSLAVLDKRFPPAQPSATMTKRHQEMRERFLERGMPDIGQLVMPDTHADHVRMFGIEFPILAVEVTMHVAGSGIDFGPRQTEVAGASLEGNWSAGLTGLHLT